MDRFSQDLADVAFKNCEGRVPKKKKKRRKGAQRNMLSLARRMERQCQEVVIRSRRIPRLLCIIPTWKVVNPIYRPHWKATILTFEESYIT